MDAQDCLNPVETDKPGCIFDKHTDSVLCCDIDTNNKHIVTGGVDDKALVWNYETKEVVFECTGHKESVNSVKFNSNADLVATGDLSGIVHVRRVPAGNLIADYYVEEITWLLWHKTYANVLFAGTISGDIWMWNVKDPSAAKVFPTTGFSSVVGQLSDDSLQIISGYSNGSVKVLDLKTAKVISQADDSAQREIISLQTCPGRSLFAVGYIDSTIKVISSTACRIVATVECKTPQNILDGEIDDTSKNEVEVIDMRETESAQADSANFDQQEVEERDFEDDAQDDVEDLNDEQSEYDDEIDSSPKESVESVLFSACGNYLIAANISGTICMWDTSNFCLRYEKHTAKRISKCVLSEDSKILTSGLDGIIRVYDFNLKELTEIQAHQDQILDIRYQSNILASCSDDKTCFVTSLHAYSNQ